MLLKALCFALVPLTALAACGGDDDGGALPDGSPTGDGSSCPAAAELLPEAWTPIDAVSAGELTLLQGSFRVDASAGGSAAAATQPFVYLDLETAMPTKVAVTDVASFDSSAWDIALKRYVIRSNGGSSGTGGVAVALVAAADLDAVATVPAENRFASDDWVGDDCSFLADAIGGPITRFSSWFAVDAGVLSPTDQVFVVRTRSGGHVALEIETYYAEPGAPDKSAVYEISWKRL
jgi:hypothetical protein